MSVIIAIVIILNSLLFAASSRAADPRDALSTGQPKATKLEGLAGDVTLGLSFNKPSVCYVILYPQVSLPVAEILPRLQCRELTIEELARLAGPVPQGKE
jgi:hypothetical protein